MTPVTPYYILYINFDDGFNKARKLYWDRNGRRWTPLKPCATRYLWEELPQGLSQWTIQKEAV